MKTLPAVFSCCHHNVLELSIWAAHSTMNMSWSALYWCHQPGPAYAIRFNVCLFISSQNQVTELLCLWRIMLERKECVMVWAAAVLTDTAAEFGLTPGRGRGWYGCWKLQGLTDSAANLGHIISWGHCKKYKRKVITEALAHWMKSNRINTYWSKHCCWPDVMNNLVLCLKTKNCFPQLCHIIYTHIEMMHKYLHCAYLMSEINFHIKRKGQKVQVAASNN